MIYMPNKYGIYQATSKSCIFYKEDDDGNQSTFNVFIAPKITEPEKNEIFSFIDNEKLKQDNWVGRNIDDVKDIIDAFGGWASDAPLLFELEAHKSLSHCLTSMMKNKSD